MTNRYDTSLNVEGMYQPGSNNLVLVNKLAITNPAEMDDTELELLNALYQDVLSNVTREQKLTVADIFEWHRRWLGNVYDWAGQERSVNMSKGNFHFTAANQIPFMLQEFESKFLGVLTPCYLMDEIALVDAIAKVHIEFILVHPFREGNGRISRLLADVMALQANKPQLDYSRWDADKEAYFAAINEGLSCNYESMKKLVMRALHDAEQLLNG